MALNKAAAAINRNIERGTAQAMERVPADRLINQAPGRTLPPGGPSGTGYPPSPHATAWADVTGTPTTLAGYGITDAASDSELAIDDGVTTVTGVTDLTVSGGTVTDDGGGAATLVITGGGVSHAYAGTTSPGASQENMTVSRVYLQKITLASAAIILSVGAYVQPTVHDVVQSLVAAVFSDNSGAPDLILAFVPPMNTPHLLLDGPSGAGGARWLMLPIGLYCPAGDYWLAVMKPNSNGTLQISYAGSGADKYYDTGATWWADNGFYTLNSTSNTYAIRASTLTGV